MLLVIVVTQLVVALVTGLVISTAYKKLDENINAGRETEHRVKKQPLADGEPLNILVMGSDSRAGAGNDIDGQTEHRRALRHHDPGAHLRGPEDGVRRLAPPRRDGGPARVRERRGREGARRATR